MDKILEQEDHLYQAIWGLEEKFPQYSVHLFLNHQTKSRFYIVFFMLLAMISIDAQQTCLIMFLLLNILYLITQLSKLFLVIIGAFVAQTEEKLIIPEELPIYSLLLPLYHEDKILAKLIQSIANIDYPADLLDAKLLIEDDDLQTLQTLESINLPSFIEVIRVPVSYPRTKPKVCNYGLQFAKGKYVVIYDAEDIPAPLQLKHAVAKFSISDKKTICIQAKLNFYNKLENSLTKCFSIEYSLLFNYVLNGLKKLRMPIPLGGSSNHFIKEKLLELGGWDAFNVTEDADLGLRIYQHGYYTELLDDNFTLEEAPISLNSWTIQRSRWIKGHILSSLVHLRHSSKLNFKEILGLYLVLFMPNISYILLPIYLLLCFYNFETNQLDLFWQCNLLLGIVLPIVYSIFIIYTQKLHNAKSAILTAPFYYFLLPIAGIRACWQIFKSPFHWDKTEHGVSKL